MGDFTTAAIFGALFYLLMNPSKVKNRMNLLVAWFIFIGAVAVLFISAFSDAGGLSRWIGRIHDLALAVSLFFMLVAVDPSAKPNVSMPSAPTGTPPTQ